MSDRSSNIYTSDASLSEPVDVMLEHALVALSIKDRFTIASRLAHNLGYQLKPNRRITIFESEK